jgi:hypothetical protein
MRRTKGVNMLAEGASRTGVPHVRPKASRLLAGASALVLVLTAISCGPSGNGTPTAPRNGSGTAPGASTTSTRGAIWTPGAVSIPTGNLPAYVQCMVDAGWQITAVYAEMSPPGYDMTHPGQLDPEMHARTEQCRALMPPTIWPSDAEIREIYKRYVDEYQCLIGLGYQPDPPPSVEVFTADFKMSNGHGPWGPIDGTGWEGWSQAQLSQAKAKCTLEMLSDVANPQR